MPEILDDEVIIDGNAVILRGDKLRKLIELVCRQEVNHLKQVKFRSESERREYLDVRTDGCRKARALLDKAEELESDSGPVKPDHFDATEMVRTYKDYVEYACGFGFMIVKNAHLRKDHMTSIGLYTDSLIIRMQRLREGGPVDVDMLKDATALMDELVAMKSMVYKSIVSESDSSAQGFSRLLKSRGITFDKLIEEYHTKLKSTDPSFDTPFDKLEVAQKIEVYNAILEASGRGAYISISVLKKIGSLGKGMIFFIVAMSVWDVYSSEHKFQTAVKESAELAAGFYGGSFAESMSTTVSTAIISSEVIESSAILAAYVGLGAIAIGFAFGIVAAMCAGWVVDKIFQSGGKHAGGAIDLEKVPTKEQLDPVVARSAVHVVRVPDGKRLARQIAYE